MLVPLNVSIWHFNTRLQNFSKNTNKKTPLKQEYKITRKFTCHVTKKCTQGIYLYFSWRLQARSFKLSRIITSIELYYFCTSFDDPSLILKSKEHTDTDNTQTTHRHTQHTDNTQTTHRHTQHTDTTHTHNTQTHTQHTHTHKTHTHTTHRHRPGSPHWAPC